MTSCFMCVLQMLNFHNNDNSYKQLLVEEHLRAKDVCHLLCMKNHILEDKSWAIIEHLGEYGFGRLIPDAYHVTAVTHVPKTFNLTKNVHIYM